MLTAEDRKRIEFMDDIAEGRIEQRMSEDQLKDWFATLQSSDKPEEKKAELESKAFGSLENQVPPQQMTKEAFKAVYGAEGDSVSTWKHIKDRYRAGKAQVRLMDLGYDILLQAWADPQAYEKNLQAIQKIQAAASPEAMANAKGFWQKTLGATSEMMPVMIEGVKAGGPMAVVGAVSGGIIAGVGANLVPGAQLTPEEAVTVPAGAKIGASLMGGAYAADRIRMLEAGGQFLELMEMTDEDGNKIDPKIAVVASHAVGVINGGLEIAQWATLAKTFGISGKLFNEAASKITKKLAADGTIRRIIGKYVAKYGVTLGAETLQELEQETTNVVFSEFAKELNNARKGSDFKSVTAEDLKNRYGQVLDQSLRSFGILSLPGPSIGMAMELVQQKAQAVEKGGVTDEQAREMVPKLEKLFGIESKTEPEVSTVDTKPPAPVEAKQGETGETVQDREGVEIADIRGKSIQTNEDGTITLYHRTTKENAQRIRKTGQFESQEQGKVFFSNKETGQAEGYGDEVISIRVQPEETNLEDAFAQGEVHLSLTTEQAQKAITQPPAPVEAKQGETQPRMEQAGGIATGRVEPNLYIGNVTPGMKARIAESGEFKAEDIQGFKEEGFPTKRTKIPMTRQEAGNYLSWAIGAIDNIVEQVEQQGEVEMTNYQVAMTQALVGDIKTLQDALGYEVKPAQIVIRRAKKLKARLEGEVLRNVPADLVSQVSDALDLTTKEGVKQAVQPSEKVIKTTYEIFRDTMKEVSKESEKAYLRGARATVKQHKNLAKLAKETLQKAQVTPGEVNKLLSAVSRARTEREQVHAMAAVQATADKARKRSISKRIFQNIPSTVDFFYRQAIEKLREGIDPKFRTEKTVRKREKTKEFIEKYPERAKDIPRKLMDKLDRKPLGDWTVEELEEVATEVERLIKQGRLKRKLSVSQAMRKLEATLDKIITNITQGKPIDESTPIIESTRDGLVKTAQQVSRAWTLRPARLFDLLDGRKNFNGPLHNFFIDRTNRIVNTMLKAIDNRIEPGTTRQKELGVNSWNLAETQVINGHKYTLDEMLSVYALSKNPLGKLAILFGNNIDQATIDAINKELTPEQKQWAEYISNDFQANYERMREVVIRTENRDMGQETAYVPMIRTDVNYTTHSAQIADEILHRSGLKKAYTQKKQTIERKHIPPEHQKPVRLGLTSIWLEQVAKHEEYIHLAEHIRDMHRIRENKKFQAAVRKRFGNEYNKVIKGYVNRVANPGVYRSYTALENLSKRLRRNAAIAYLSYNMVTMAKQLPSVFLYLQDAGPVYLLASAAEFFSGPKKLIQKVRDLDPQVKHKALERELEEIRMQKKTVGAQVLKLFGETGLEGIYLMDSVARTIGWNAVYQKALALNKSEAEAIRLAQNATLRTQPAAMAKDLPQLYASNEFANWFTMFTNQLNQIYNIASYDVPSYIINKQYGDAALASTGMGIVALVIWSISHREYPDEPEDFAQAATEQFVNAIPLFGKSIQTGMRGWGNNDIPAFEGGLAIGKGGRALYERDFTDKDIQQIAEGVAVSAGIPYIGPKRIIEAAKEGEPGKLIGMRSKRRRSSRRSMK